MKSEQIFDAIGEVDDRYLVSAWSRIDSRKERFKQKKMIQTRAFPRGFAYAAAMLVLLVSAFSVAMTVNADFRNAVFRFFHIHTADVVLPKEEEPGQPGGLGDINTMGSTNLEGRVDVTYLQVNGNMDWSNGVVWTASYEEETAGQILGAYGVQNGQLMRLEPHVETLEYLWDGEPWQINFEWYENNGRICTRARDYDPETNQAWEVLAKDGQSDLCVIILSRGAQLEYTSRPLLYNLRTKKITDVLAECRTLDSQLINEIEFSPDLSAVLLSCNQGSDYYYYNMAGRTLKSLRELTGRDVWSAWFLDDNTIGCTFKEADGTYTCRAIAMPSGDSVEIYTGMREKNRDTDFGLIFTGGRYGLFVDENRNTYVCDYKTGERALVEGFQYPSGNTFTSRNEAGNKILFSLSDDNAEGLGVSQIGILDLEKRSFTLLDREGYETRREISIGWFDNDRVAIQAATDAERTDSSLYLYIYAIK